MNDFRCNGCKQQSSGNQYGLGTGPNYCEHTFPIEESVSLNNTIRIMREALNQQIDLWQIAKPILDNSDDAVHAIRFMDFYKPIELAEKALQSNQGDKETGREE